METDEKRWRVIVGLGNPGRQYAANRHNIGFMVLDQLASKHKLKFNKVLNRGIAAIGEGDLRRVVLLKPQTFMNDSGACVSPTLNFYKCRQVDMLVIYDELDLPFGQLRMRGGGSAAGHNGVRSIIKHIGTQEFPRLRFGVGRPPGRMSGADYVLQNFVKSETDALHGGLIADAIAGAELWLKDGLERAMNVVNIGKAD